MNENQYTYRLPRWFIIGLGLFGFGPPLAITLAAAVVTRSWVFGIVVGLGILLVACLALYLWSRIRIVMDTEGIRWPLRGRELRWEDVQSSAMVRVLGLQYVRVVMKNSRTAWIALSHPGGAEFRRRLLSRLGLE